MVIYNLIIYAPESMESNFFVLQVTTAILRESGSAVQGVYYEKFSNQDQLNIGEAVVT